MPKLAPDMSLDEILHRSFSNGVYAIGHYKGLCLQVNNDGRFYAVRKHVGDTDWLCVLGPVTDMSLKSAIEIAKRIEGNLIDETKSNGQPLADIRVYCSQRETHGGAGRTLYEVIKDVLENPELNHSAAQDQAKRALDRKSLINKFLCSLDSRKVVMGKQGLLLDPRRPIKDIPPEQFAEMYSISTREHRYSRDHNFKCLIIEVLERAFALGCYSLENLERFKLLTGQMSKASYQHLPGLNVERIPDLIADLWQYSTGSGIFARAKSNTGLNENALAYIFSILTVARSQAVRLLQWQEIDFARGIWDMNPAHDKIKLPNRVRSIVLSSGALAMLDLIKSRHEDCSPYAYVFVPPRKGAHLNDAGFKVCIRQINAKRIEHGLEPYLDYGARDKEQQPRIITQHATARACFATWAADREGINTSFRQSVIELCLLHQNPNIRPYGYAYNRSALIHDRRIVLEDWSDCCLSKCEELRALAAKTKQDHPTQD